VGGLGRQVPFLLPSATLCRVLHSAKRDFAECRPFAECRALCGTQQSHSLPSARLCQVPPGPALDKEWLRRVPDFWHSAKLAALGKYAFSRSVWRYPFHPTFIFLVLAFLVNKGD